MKAYRKAIVLFTIPVLFFLLTGLEFFKEVEINYKKPLIDLYGNTSDENPFNYSEEVNDLKDTESAGTEVKDDGKAKSAEDRHIIGIKYKTVTWDGRECDINELNDLIEKRASGNTLIVLWDNYAEYHCYEEVRNRVERLKEKKGFSFSEKVLEETR